MSLPKKQKKKKQIPASTFNLKKIEDTLDDILEDINKFTDVSKVLGEDGFMIVYVGKHGDNVTIRQVGANIDEELVIGSLLKAMNRLLKRNTDVNIGRS
jgi:hypothetical protein